MGRIKLGKAFGLELPLAQVVPKAYPAMDERRTINTSLTA
jgi:hypothetical protein